MTATLQTPWGSDGSDIANNAPNEAGWDYLAEQFRGTQANVQPDASGWVVEHEWGAETIVAIGGLVTTLLVLNVQNYSANGLNLANTTGQIIKLFVTMNRGVVPDANLANVYIVAISNDANVANVNLVYSDPSSNAKSGELIFVSAAFDASNASINGFSTTLAVNSTSALHGVVLPRLPIVGAVAANGTPFSSNLVFTIA
jgi:hypothetical protein